jgi:hypothetical protein
MRPDRAHFFEGRRMRLVSLLSRRQKQQRRRRAPEPEEPRASKSAIARALRHTKAASSWNSAAELGTRIATALSTIETAVLTIDMVSDRLREAAGLLRSAGESGDLGRRALFAGRYDDVRAEIDAAVGAATHNRVNLVNGRLIAGRHPAFDIALDEQGRAGIAISVVNLTTGEGGLALSPPRSAFAEDEEIATIAAEIVAAQKLVAEVGNRFADHAALIADRLSRLQHLAGGRTIEPHLPTGADPEPDFAGESGEPMELGVAEVEQRLRQLADRLNQREVLAAE